MFFKARSNLLPNDTMVSFVSLEMILLWLFEHFEHFLQTGQKITDQATVNFRVFWEFANLSSKMWTKRYNVIEPIQEECFIFRMSVRRLSEWSRDPWSRDHFRFCAKMYEETVRPLCAALEKCRGRRWRCCSWSYSQWRLMFQSITDKVMNQNPVRLFLFLFSALLYVHHCDHQCQWGWFFSG